MVIKPGSVIEFNYELHDPQKQRIGKVTYIRDTLQEPLSPSTVYSNPWAERSRYLLTCLMADGTYRHFYDAGLANVTKVGIFRRVTLNLSGVKFRAPINAEVTKVGKVGRRRIRLFNGRIVPSTPQVKW